MVGERWERAKIREARYKAYLEKYYNMRVLDISCKVRDRVLTKNEGSRVENEGNYA